LKLTNIANVLYDGPCKGILLINSTGVLQSITHPESTCLK